MNHDVFIPIKAKEAIAILRKYCPDLAQKSNAQLNMLLNKAVKTGKIQGFKFNGLSIYTYSNLQVTEYAKHLRDCRKVAGDVPEQCELPIEEKEEKRDLCFTITVNNNFQF